MDSQTLTVLLFCLTCVTIVGIIAIVALKGGNRINFKAHMSSLEDTKVELEVEDNDIKKNKWFRENHLFLKNSVFTNYILQNTSLHIL